MSKLASQQPETDLAEEIYGPSRLEERPPELGRSLGMFGWCLLGASLLMLLWNAIRTRLGGEAKLPFFSQGWVLFCSFVGVALTFYHAAVDRALEIRRAYGLLSWLALILGGMAALVWTVHTTWGSVALSVLSAIIAGFLALIVTVCPWVLAARDESEAQKVAENENAPETTTVGTVASSSIWAKLLAWPNAAARFFGHWNSFIGTDVTVTRVTFTTAVLVVLSIVLSVLLITRWSWPALPNVSMVAMLVGLAFLMTVAKHERHETWRQAAAYTVAYAGYVAFAASLAYLVRDLFVLSDAGQFAPVGLLAGVLSLLLFLAHINLAGTDADSSYYSAFICLVGGGLLIAALSILRSLLPPVSFYLSDTWRPSPYFITNGLLALVLGLLQFTVGLVAVSNNQLIAIVRRELLAYFYTPSAYLVLAGLAIIAGIQYLWWISILYAVADQLDRRAAIFQEPVVQYYLYGLLPVLALLAIPPFLTMRLFSEEKRTGTLEVLLAAPVSDTVVVLGKFFGAWAFFLVAWGLWLVFPLIFRFLMGQPFDYRPLLSFYVGTAVMAMSFIGLGVFFSALTDNQVIAAVLSYAGILGMFVPQLVHWQISWARRGTGEWLGKLVEQLALLEQCTSFVHGQLYLQHLLYHGSIAALFLFLTVRVLEARKWK